MQTQQRILTDADQLLGLIQQHNVVSVKKAARILDREPDMIVLLAESLEEHGSIVVHYTIGDPLLVDKEHYETTRGSVRLLKPAIRSLLGLGVGKRTKHSYTERERALDERARMIDKRTRLLEERTRSLEKQADALGTLETDIAQREERIRHHSSQLERREHELARRERGIEHSASILKRREEKIRNMLENARRLFD